MTDVRALEQLDRDLAAQRRRVGELRSQLATTRQRTEQLGAQLRLDGAAKPLSPLVWALIGVMLALGVGFCTYLTGLLALNYPRPDSDTSSALAATVVLLFGAALSLGASRRPGAGGSARLLLHRVTAVLIAICLLALSTLPLWLWLRD